MASKKNGLANWPARGHCSHPLSQGVVQQDSLPSIKLCWWMRLNPLSQGVVQQDWTLKILLPHRLSLNPLSQGVVQQDPNNGFYWKSYTVLIP